MNPVEILSALGSLASLASFADVVLKSNERDRILLDRAEAAGEVLATKQDAVAEIAAAMRDPVVEAIAERIRDRKNRAAHKIRSGGSVTAETQEMIADICEFLNAVRAQQGGQITQHDLSEIWNNFGCENI